MNTVPVGRAPGQFLPRYSIHYYAKALLMAVCSSWSEVLTTYTVLTLERTINLVYDLSYCGQIARYNADIKEDKEEESF